MGGNLCTSTTTKKRENEHPDNEPQEMAKENMPVEGKALAQIPSTVKEENIRQGKYMVEDKEDILINNQILIQKSGGTPLEKYEIVKNLGEGSFGKVFLVRHKDTKLIRAMKEITKDEETNEADIINEINILKKLDHPHIVKIYEFFSFKDKFYLITEYCKEGELYEQINIIRHFSEDHAAYIIYQILGAINYCHSNNIIHRDLKPENLLIEGKDSNGHFLIKVIDFGTAKVFDRSKKEKKLIGSCYYIAPEVIKKNYNEKCDLWSAGVILYILISGQPPFSGNTDEDTFEKILNSPLQFRDKVFNSTSSEVKELIKNLLDKNPKTRLTATEALTHPWFKKFKIKEKVSAVSDSKLKSFITNLKAYKPTYKLQQAAVAIICHNLPHTDEVKELERAFRKIDLNGDGKLTKEELVDGFVQFFGKNKDAAKEEVNTIFRNVDNDNNGYIEYEEFIRACIDKEKLLDDNYLKLAFNFFDADGSGQITLKELKEVFCGGGDIHVSAQVIQEIIGDIDNDGDSQISYEEFRNMMRKILS